jgi:hypothetical protein
MGASNQLTPTIGPLAIGSTRFRSCYMLVAIWMWCCHPTTRSAYGLRPSGLTPSEPTKITIRRHAESSQNGKTATELSQRGPLDQQLGSNGLSEPKPYAILWTHLVNSVSVWSDTPLSVAVSPNLRAHWDRALLRWVSHRTGHHNSLMHLLGSVASLRPSLAHFFTPFSNVLTPKVSQLQVS